jgi:hypothetical protein
MTTEPRAQKIIIFGGSHANRIRSSMDRYIPNKKEYKGKMYTENRAKGGHSLSDLRNLPKQSEVKKDDILIILSGGNDIFEKHLEISMTDEGKRICLSKCVPNPLSYIENQYKDLRDALALLDCKKFIITNPYRHILCCKKHEKRSEKNSYIGNIFSAQNRANKCLIQTLQETATVLKFGNVFGLGCKEKRYAQLYKDLMCDSVHFRRRSYFRASDFLLKLVYKEMGH